MLTSCWRREDSGGEKVEEDSEQEHGHEDSSFHILQPDSLCFLLFFHYFSQNANVSM